MPTISLTELTIDGTTQGVFANVPPIELNGGGANASGLKITSGSVTVKSLISNRFNYYGISASSSVALNVYGSYIGTDANGSTALGNGQSGIFLSPNDDNIVSNIGGTDTNQRNVISGNGGNGIWIEGFYSA